MGLALQVSRAVQAISLARLSTRLRYLGRRRLLTPVAWGPPIGRLVESSTQRVFDALMILVTFDRSQLPSFGAAGAGLLHSEAKLAILFLYRGCLRVIRIDQAKAAPT
jgi:hypothetical protein